MTTTNILKRLGDFIPQLSLAVIILALLKSFIYYSHFNLPIKFYLGFSELGMTIADDLLINVPLFIILYYTLLNKKQSESKVDLKKKNEMVRIRFINKRVTSEYWVKVMVIALILVMLILGYFNNIFGTASYGNRLSWVIQMLSFSILLLVSWKLYTKEIVIDIDNILSGIVISIFTFFILIAIRNDIKAAEHGQYKGTIVTTDKEYKSNDSTFFIGQTSSYIFFHNRNSNTNIILPASEIKKVILVHNDVDSILTK